MGVFAKAAQIAVGSRDEAASFGLAAGALPDRTPMALWIDREVGLPTYVTWLQLALCLLSRSALNRPGVVRTAPLDLKTQFKRLRQIDSSCLRLSTSATT